MEATERFGQSVSWQPLSGAHARLEAPAPESFLTTNQKVGGNKVLKCSSHRIFIRKGIPVKSFVTVPYELACLIKAGWRQRLLY